MLCERGMGQGQNAENATSRGREVPTQAPKEERCPPRKLRRRGNQEVNQMDVGATETKMS